MITLSSSNDPIMSIDAKYTVDANVYPIVVVRKDQWVQLNDKLDTLNTKLDRVLALLIAQQKAPSDDVDGA